MGVIEYPKSPEFVATRFSGASLERAALQRLLDNLDDGKVDCVVVYKVDRLSRSLLDFARLVDRFDPTSIPVAGGWL